MVSSTESISGEMDKQSLPASELAHSSLLGRSGPEIPQTVDRFHGHWAMGMLDYWIPTTNLVASITSLKLAVDILMSIYCST